MTPAASRWLRVLRAVPDPRARLICFPHAGGTASFFRSWPRWLPADVEVAAVRYPGREDRIGEPCPAGMRELSDAIVSALLPLTDRPLVLFGHSMGASVAHEVALGLTEEHAAPPAALLVSARCAPQRLRPTGTGDLPDDELIAEVVRRGGPVSAALDHPEVRELALPAIRADYRLLDRYAAEVRADAGVRADADVRVGAGVRAGRVRLATPVTAYYGERDDKLPVDDVLAWSATTDAGFAARGFPGGHFYLVPDEPALVGDVTERLTSAVPAPPGPHTTERTC
ncbi:thioesterase II family protein [Streptomyces sp. URMC 123]|uniref:thioesterase II family protein n=1 Tax=Streptomyces sp. URMC 123 TaxID=3423403 RepID=UPI003F1C6993